MSTYLKLFKNIEQYNSFISSDEFVRPNVSVIFNPYGDDDSYEVMYNSLLDDENEIYIDNNIWFIKSDSEIISNNILKLDNKKVNNNILYL